MLAAGDHEFDVGSYSCAEAMRPLYVPPATRTLPLGRRVAVWPARFWDMLPAEDHVFVVGSYSSAEETPPYPPATRTLPFRSSVAVWLLLGAAIVPAEFHSPTPADAGTPVTRRNDPTSVTTTPTLRARTAASIMAPPSFRPFIGPSGVNDEGVHDDCGPLRAGVLRPKDLDHDGVRAGRQPVVGLRDLPLCGRRVEVDRALGHSVDGDLGLPVALSGGSDSVDRRSREGQRR